MPKLTEFVKIPAVKDALKNAIPPPKLNKGHAIVCPPINPPKLGGKCGVLGRV